VGAQRIVGLEHVTDVESRGERPAFFHVLVVMRSAWRQFATRKS
jgi:hypothetical protein